MDLKEIMAVNLRRKRHDLQMTQEELAARAGIGDAVRPLSSAASTLRE